MTPAMQAASAIFGALLTLAACYSLGSALGTALGLRLTQLELFPFGLVLGASVLHLGIFAILALKLAYTPVLLGLLGASLAIGIASGAWRFHAGVAHPADRIPAYARYLLGAIASVYFFVYLANAWAPEFSPDGSSYHLSLVARYLRVHGFEPVPTNVYSTLSGGVDVLFVPAFAIGGHSAAALVHFGFLIALGLAMLAYGYRIGKPVAGASAALLVCLAPVAGVDGTSAYVDVAGAATVFVVFRLAEIWEERRETGLLVALGLVGGYCYAIKYTLAVMLVYAVGFVFWKERRVRPVLVILAAASVMILPWMAKNWIFAGNPIAPFANTIFRNQWIHPEFERYWSQVRRTYGLPSLWSIPAEVTFRGGVLGGVLGPAFVAAPLALWALRSQQGRRILTPAALLIAVYFGNVGTRFLIPALPFVSLALMLVLERSAPLLMLLIAGHAVASWPSMLHRYSASWALTQVPYKAALRLTSEEEFLGRRQEYRVARMIEANVPEGGRVLSHADILNAYTSREILVGYQGALNAVLEDVLEVATLDFYQPKRVRVFPISARRVRGMRVVQTASMPNPEVQWSIHEVRVFSGGAELPRDPRWRLSAFPNPWDVTMAFDNSEATRWRTWETARPGNYVAIDFGREETVDEVRLETAGGDESIKLQLEALDGNGQWTALVANGTVRSEELRFTYDGSLKKAATYELHKRGVDYIVVRDTDWNGPIFSEDPTSWGVRVMARVGAAGSGTTLYRINVGGD